MIKKRIIKKSTLLFLILTVLFYLVPNTIYSQGPNAAEAASFEPVDATDMVNLVTGDLSYVLPLLNVPSPEGGYPIALSYHAGIAMDQEASWVGLGWSLNPGTINRGVNGYPDDWGKTNVNEFFYDQGWTENYYSFGAGATFGGGLSVGLGLSWGSDQSLGGFVSAGIGPKTGENGPSVGVQIGTEGTSIYGGVGQFTANVGTNGVGVGYGRTSSLGVSLNYNYNSGLSGGASVRQGRSSTGINFSSNGISMNANIKGAGISTASYGISAGDYDVNASTMGITIPIYIFYVSYSHTKVKYALYKYNNLYTSGMVYPVAANELQPYDDGSGLSRRMRENHFMDVNVIQKFGTGDKYDDLITDSNNYNLNNLILPNYDNYTVNAQGLSGSISPYIHSELNLSARGRGEQNADNEYVQYLNYDYEQEYTKSVAAHGQPVNYDAISKKYFSFTSSFNSFLRLETSSVQGIGGIATNEYLMKTFKTSSTYSFDNYQSLTNNNRKREGNSIETYTNKEIREGSFSGFIDATTDGWALNRQDKEVFLDEGIGAFKITSLDGKTYHYSLPVYQFESFYKNFKDETDEDKNFFEIKKTSPYATHWLLTAITGPDYIDSNNNGKVDEKDYGYWVEFDYGKWSDGYIWKTPNGRNEEINDIDNTANKTYAYSWGRKQIYYLDAIKTRTHTALFIKNVRNDNKSLNKQIYSSNVNGSTFNYSVHPKIFSEIKTKKFSNAGDIFYDENGNEVILEKDSYGAKVSYNYTDIPSIKSLYLKKIILLKNSNLNTDYLKANGNLIEGITPHGLLLQNEGYNYIYSFTSNNSINWNLSNPKLFKNKFASMAKDFLMFLQNNVIDIKDIEGLGLESKASQVIEFEHDYSLANGAPNTEVNSGRLTLNKVNFKGKKGVQLVPPYEFNYKDTALPYNKDDIDAWGYHKTNPQIWSLSEITTPTGGKININYENDKYLSAIDHTIKFTQFNSNSKISEDPITANNIQPQYYIIESEDNLGIQIGDELDLYHSYQCNGDDPQYGGQINLGECVFDGKARIIESIGLNKFKLQPIYYGPTCMNIEYYDASGDGDPTNDYNNWNCNYTEVEFYATYKLKNEIIGGGIRTNSITISEGNKDIVKTEYVYEKGITSYAPSKEPRGVPYVSELPAPMVMYGNVTMLNKDGSGNKLGSTAYEFETLQPRKEESGYIFSLGEAFRVRENQNETFESGKVIANKYTIESKLGNLGRIKSITSYNNKNQVLNKKENTYKQNLDTDGEIGVTQESHISYKRVKKYDVEKFYVSSTSKVNYPSVLESTKQTQSGFSIEKHFDKYDFLIGQLLETRTYASDGTAFKTKTVPAYTKYPQMGSKVDNITNKNMLTQQAASYTYLLDEVNNTEKVIGAGITTWNNNWIYRDHSGLETTPTNDVEKIWRKHKSFVWGGDIDSDGAYVGFNATNDDGFQWDFIPGLKPAPTKWKQTSEVKRYDHYSAPLEMMDINFNYASTKMCDKDSKIMAVSNAKYTEMFYSGAEYLSPNNNLYFDGEVKSSGRSSVKAHTGIYSAMASTANQHVFEVNLKGVVNGKEEHRAGKYKVSVWVDKTNYLNARININGSTKTFNGEQIIAGDWVLLNHYEDLSSDAETVYLTSASGTCYFDDFRLLPIASSITSYVYNDWDELWYVIGNNGLATRYEYDEAGRLIRTFTEVVDTNCSKGGFNKISENDYHYKAGVNSAPISTSTYSIEERTDGNGTVSFSSDVIDEGSNVTVTITPNTGYEIASIKVNCISQPINNSFTISNVTSNTVVDVEFSISTATTQRTCLLDKYWMPNAGVIGEIYYYEAEQEITWYFKSASTTPQVGDYFYTDATYTTIKKPTSSTYLWCGGYSRSFKCNLSTGIIEQSVITPI